MVELAGQHAVEEGGVPPVAVCPEGAAWSGMIAGFRPPAEAAEFRRELGLPEAGRVVMTGHQAQIWHPGILAKYLAVDSVVSSLGAGAAAAWLVVDQDVHEAGVVRVPVVSRSAGEGLSTLRVERWSALAPRAEEEHLPLGLRPARRPSPPPVLEPGESFAAPGVLTGAERIAAALGRFAANGSLAQQIAAATGELMRPLIREPGTNVMSLAISRTRLFGELVQRLRLDHGRCREAYNRAVARHPRERTQSLNDNELPLWVIDPSEGGGRRRALVADLDRLPASSFAPRALMMTGLLRWAGCDLFVHGTGGGGGGLGAAACAKARSAHEGYDRITEEWFDQWLDAGLAPMAVVTATLRLGMDYAGPSASELQRRRWARHRARHDPALLGDATAAADKRRFIDRIRAERRAGRDARPLYRQMHALLDSVRAAHGATLLEVDRLALDAATRQRDAEIAADRTWAFPLYQTAQLEDLRRRIAGGFGGG